jgi:hypothetical protein
MNWDAIGAVGEILGAIAVFVSLLYLAIQIRSTTNQSKSLMIALSFLLGTVMIMLGVLGEYLWRILDEIRARNPYVIDEFYD